MKKICYVVTISLTIKSFFVKQLQYLSENGFDVTVICSPDDSLQDILGSKIKFVPVAMPRGISIGGSIASIIKLTSIFKKQKFDLIQYSTPNAAFYASIAAKSAGCKVRNYHLMGFRFLGALGVAKTILKWIEKTACKNSTSIECVSKSNLEIGIKEGLFPREKATVVWNGSTGGVDLLRFDFSKRERWRNEIRNTLGYKEDDFIYGFVGRITKDKGINELLTAFLNLKDDSKLLLVGDIEKENRLDNALLKTAHKNNNILFHGFVSDIERYFAAIDVLVLPSYREGFGNVVIEAGAVGTPSIVSNIPGPIDAIEVGKTALAVEVGDVKALEDAMIEIYKIDYKTAGQNAAYYCRDKFDSNILCDKIAERKRYLLSI
ncbi:MAG: glycosyltransferase family 4 protein [Clostridia bacterium]|nr:glycosyltransferase family 4 protein [Clostridia bacterium]